MNAGPDVAGSIIVATAWGKETISCAGWVMRSQKRVQDLNASATVIDGS